MLTPKQERQLEESVEQLAAETEGFSDAITYASDLVAELGIPIDEVVAAIKRHYGVHPRD